MTQQQFTQIPYATPAIPSLVVTIFDGDNRAIETDLTQFESTRITFGRSSDNDIVVPSNGRVVSRHHGVFLFQGGVWNVCDLGSTNGIRVNGMNVDKAPISAGDIVAIGRIDDPGDCVIFTFSLPGMRWKNLPLSRFDQLRIGRLPDNDLVLPTSSVSGYHALITRSSRDRFIIQDLQSYNGTYVMGYPVNTPRVLYPGDFISISLTTLVFTGTSLLYSIESRGVDLVARDLVQIRKSKKGKRVTTDHVSLHINRGDFVAIVGGSGSGKSTLLNELNGSDPAVEGQVLIDGIDFYPNYNFLKSAIGYVPQQDIVHDNLTLFDMLCYAAELRMPPDSTKQEREQRVNEVIDLLELAGERDNYIARLSGGQKKRASIAVELLADPRLLFLDEPTSGLDPGIERDLMHKLARMAQGGRTIILVTHTTLNLHLCSQVIFLGAGGKLCYAGAPQGALDFFGEDDFVSIYDKITENPDHWASAFASGRTTDFKPSQLVGDQIAPRRNLPFFRQLSTLSRRYARLVINDKQRLLLLLGQAPILAALICLVAGADCFKVCEETQSCLFALSCAAFWVGILDSIQEICKERSILKREYAGGLSLPAYISSKVLVLGALCIVQSALLTGVFCLMNGLPPAEPLFFNTGLELYITMLLLTLSAMCLGLWVSALFSNPDRAIAMAPILIMPQVLFSGLIFKLEGIAQTISIIVHCRWGMEAFGTTSDLNSLDMKIYGDTVTVPASTQHIDSAEVPVPDTTTTYQGMEIEVKGETKTIENFDVDVPEQTRTIDSSMYPHEVDHAYDHLLPHLLTDWGVLALFCVVSILLSGFTLKGSLKR